MPPIRGRTASFAISGMNLVANFTAGSYPAAMVYNPFTGGSRRRPSSDAVYAVSGGSVVATLGVGSTPTAFAYDPEHGYIYVSNYGSDTLSLIPQSTGLQSGVGSSSSGAGGAQVNNGPASFPFYLVGIPVTVAVIFLF